MRVNYLTALLVMTVSLSSGAQDKKITREQLPKAVAATVDRETQGATVKGFVTERENGKKVYEAETVIRGHTRDLEIAADGTLNEVEEEVAMKDLPASVQAAILAKAKGASVVKVESLIKKGKLVAYEASTIRNGHKGEVQVGPTGRRLAHEE